MNRPTKPPQRPPARTATVVLSLTVLLSVPSLSVLGWPATASARSSAHRQGDDRHYRPPVDAPVIDGFRPPTEIWGPGNRGLEYSTTPGTVVGAIGPGVVTFAGPVAGSLYVTVEHPDGLRSSYSYVASIRVRVGDRVRTGDAVATTGTRLHLGVRRGDHYLDPASLWGTAVGGGRVRLVPTDASPTPPQPRPSRAEASAETGARGAPGPLASGAQQTIATALHGLVPP